MSETVTVKYENHIADVRLNRPDKRNAITGDMLEALRDVALEIAGDKSVYAVVISGEGGHFSAGIDTDYMLQMQSGELSGDSDSVANTVAVVTESGANEAQQAAWAWQELPQPVVAAVSGCVMGVGVDIAKLLVLTGREISGERAVALGLGTLLHDDPLAEAMTLAHELAGNNPEAVQQGKALLNYVRTASPREGLQAESAAMSKLLGTDNQVEAVTARFENRAPVFKF